MIRRKLAHASAWIIVTVARVLVWIIDKGPFFPPFGSRRGRGASSELPTFCPECDTPICTTAVVNRDHGVKTESSQCPNSNCGWPGVKYTSKAR